MCERRVDVLAAPALAVEVVLDEMALPPHAQALTQPDRPGVIDVEAGEQGGPAQLLKRQGGPRPRRRRGGGPAPAPRGEGPPRLAAARAAAGGGTGGRSGVLGTHTCRRRRAA